MCLSLSLLSLQQLAVNYAAIVCFSVSEVASALESIRSQAVKRGMGNKTYRETFVATLELLLPKDGKKVCVCVLSLRVGGCVFPDTPYRK